MDLEFQLGKRGDRRARKSEEGSRRFLVLGDFGARESRGRVEVGDALTTRALVRVRQERFDEAVAAVAPRLTLPGAPQPLEVSALDDFHPDTLFRRLSLFRDPPRAPAPVGAVAVGEGDADDVARLLGRRPAAPPAPQASAADTLIGQIVSAHSASAPRAEAPLDAAALGRTMGAVLRDAGFRALEARWRALELLASRADEQIEIWLLDLSRAELVADLLADGAADGIEETALARRLLSPPGGRGFSVLVADLSFGPGAEDLSLLGRLGRLAAGLGAPLVAGAAPALLGCRDLFGAVDPARWPALAPADAQRWQGLRRTVEAGWVGLALPRFLARAPYGARTGAIESFRFEEIDGQPEAETLCWASSAFLCALALARAADPDGGDGADEIDDLPFFSFRNQGELEMYPLAEVFWGQRAADAALARGLTPVLGARDRNIARIVRLQSISDPPSALGDGLGIGDDADQGDDFPDDRDDDR
ncbi:MAG TPA: type VI secretion system contractile sheath large subunit [Polyangia bacterium]|jgi:type VI secretion system protein ImpC|nr:type VI secretion system contractile sheath large subunit [Polyangia bacterium]